MAKIDKDYDWLEDPFNEKPDEDEGASKSGMSTGSKVAVSIGCLAVLVIFVLVLFLSCTTLSSLVVESQF